MGTQLPCPKRGQIPQFSAHVYCGKTAGWMKIPLATEIDLSPGHIVLDGDPVPPDERGAAAPFPPLFGLCLLWSRLPSSATAELLLHSSRQTVRILYSDILDPYNDVVYMATLCNRAGHFIFVLWFFFLLLSSSFYPRLILAVADWMSTILPHMAWP